ncbi:CopG family transcriptional regulator [Azospirillum melinis]|uniref:CopG family transcriptional regulator n=1 Tax=Azospirillum melinis TaxID=328839 RepID=A0ABX2KGH9_9PROT|nr:CopG family transcriptional regulator [Azospirillum melinis]
MNSEDDRKSEQKEEVKKVTVNLPKNEVQFLQRVAKQENLSFTDVLRRSIRSEKFFVENENSGKKILVQSDDNELREIWRR